MCLGSEWDPAFQAVVRALSPQVLFDKALKPGGVYFIEDLLASRWGKPWLDPEPERLVMVGSPGINRGIAHHGLQLAA